MKRREFLSAGALVSAGLLLPWNIPTGNSSPTGLYGMFISPGWIRYGVYYNENNTWWPHFHLYNEYNARMSAVLRNSVMFADIAILPPNDDMWSLLGMQMEPFPNITHVDWFLLVWEAINKNGNGCDYVSQRVIRDSEVKAGCLCHGPQKYHSLFLIHIESLDPAAAGKILDFVTSCGRVFCVETIPAMSTGWNESGKRDARVREIAGRMKIFPDRENSIELSMGPASSFLFVFGKEKTGKKWEPLPVQNPLAKKIQYDRTTEFRHCHDGSVRNLQIDELKDLKDIPESVSFSGTVIYKNTINVDDAGKMILNLGKVYGTSGLKVNGRSCGVKWFGRRIFDITGFMKPGTNQIEIEVTTSIGNYLKSLTDNSIAQYRTNEKTKVQPMGLIGPVTLY